MSAAREELAGSAYVDYGPEAIRALRMIAGLGVAYGYERSFKVKPGELLTERFLLTVHKNSLGPDPLPAVLSICEELSAPDIFKDAIAENIRLANIVHLGFEKGGDALVHKLYLEYPGDRRLETRNLVYLSFKWDTARPDKQTIAKYTAVPPLPLPELISNLIESYDIKEKTAFSDLLCRLLDMAARRVPGGRLFILDVEEENNPRRSFDVNLYDAGLRVADIEAVLREIWAYFDIENDGLERFYETIKDEKLGHYSAGIDRSGEGFSTVFFGVKEGLSAKA